MYHNILHESTCATFVFTSWPEEWQNFHFGLEDPFPHGLQKNPSVHGLHLFIYVAYISGLDARCINLSTPNLTLQSLSELGGRSQAN